ncbi:MAG: DUF3772 domain-containing protein [Silicimonas sp.]|nr:DUF3772 domain-containing protein [Silicimonas sp.]
MRRVIASWAAVALLIVWQTLAAPVFAQERPDYETFEGFADAVGTDLQEDRLSDTGFENLREDLVAWRERFLAADDVNSVQIDALSAQIEALGPAPADGETEPADIANRREELLAALAEAREPRIRAEEAHARAAALIGRIDATLRSRQTDALFQLQPSPLRPSIWQKAVARVSDVAATVKREVETNVTTRVERGTLWDRMPVVVFLLLAAAVLITRGPRWVERLIARIEARSGELGRVVYGFLISLGGIAVPLLGISLINLALISTGILGPTGERVALGANIAVLTYASGRWLGRRIFPDGGLIPSPLVHDEGVGAEGRLLALAAGLLVGLLVLIGIVIGVEGSDVEIASVLFLPVFVGLGVVLYRLGRILAASAKDIRDDDSSSGFRGYVIGILGRVVQTIGAVAPVLAAIGYFRMSAALLAPTTITLGILALLAVLHIVIRAAYGLARGLDSEAAGQALAPVLITFLLGLGSMPFIAVIWGARWTDIGELWGRFRTGFQLGDTTISPGVLITFGLVFGIGFLLTRLLQGTMRSSVLPRTRIDKGGQNAIVSGLGYLGLTLAAIIGITSAGIDLSNMAIIVGALGVGIGFGLQNIVNNFVSGIILLIERPISEGDWVEVNGQMGTVRSISVRSTVIETFDRTDVIVPNGDLISGTVTNWTRGNSIGRVIVPVGVAYGTDTRRVEKILREVAEAHPIVTVNPPPVVLFRGFGADSLDFEIRAILTDVSFVMNVHSDMNHEIARRFQEETIEIPFAQRDIWLRNPDALASATAPRSEPRPASDAIDPALSEPDAGDAE